MKFRILLVISFVLIYFSGFGQQFIHKKWNPPITLGAYYFDGWTGAYPYHITPQLVTDFKERESKWGWHTSSQLKVNEQIKSAKKYGISFFSFCWYFNGKKEFLGEPLNNALGYFKKSNDKSMQFCLMVANHTGYEIGPDNWDAVTEEWLKNFDEKNYLFVNNRPLIIFFSLESLIKTFGSTDLIKVAFEQFEKKAISRGFKGVTTAVCLGPGPKEIGLAEKSGFNMLTGYNYHAGAIKKNTLVTPIDSMIKIEEKLWDRFTKLSKLKYIPVSTLNWDPRPWTKSKEISMQTPRFEGFSKNSVNKSIKGIKTWIDKNAEFTTVEKIALIYAWNEYGEGAYLTPTKFNGDELLKGVRSGLNK